MINENKIREACSSDRERGFKMLMNSFQVPIYNYIRRLVVSHEDAEDVLQEVFIRIFRHIDQFREESSLSTWIYRIATNESLRLLNSRKEEGVVSAEDVQVYHAASDVPEAKAEPTEVDSTLIKTDPEPRAAVAETVPEIPEASVATPGVVTDTVRAGRFLTTMAQKHYGKKKFWVYIYMENIDKLGDPDLIPPMTTVVIPPASKYGIKPGDRASEEAAERKAAEIMSRYSKN